MAVLRSPLRDFVKWLFWRNYCMVEKKLSSGNPQLVLAAERHMSMVVIIKDGYKNSVKEKRFGLRHNFVTTNSFCFHLHLLLGKLGTTFEMLRKVHNLHDFQWREIQMLKKLAENLNDEVIKWREIQTFK